MVRKTTDETLRDEKEVVQYLKLDEKNQAKVQLLCDHFFGTNYASILVSAPNEEIWMACVNGEPVGFCKYLFNQTEPYSDIILSDQPYSLVNLVGVLPNFRELGIAKKLVNCAMESTPNNPVFGVAWEIDGKARVMGVFAAVGIHYKGNLGHIWKQQCENNEFRCPVKKHVCICTASLYSTD
jgi:GNAT superfamily N-acetyltransferase